MPHHKWSPEFLFSTFIALLRGSERRVRNNGAIMIIRGKPRRLKKIPHPCYFVRHDWIRGSPVRRHRVTAWHTKRPEARHFVTSRHVTSPRNCHASSHTHIQSATTLIWPTDRSVSETMAGVCLRALQSGSANRSNHKTYEPLDNESPVLEH